MNLYKSIAFFVCPNGLGHLRRAISIIEKLLQIFQVSLQRPSDRPGASASHLGDRSSRIGASASRLGASASRNYKIFEQSLQIHWPCMHVTHTSKSTSCPIATGARTCEPSEFLSQSCCPSGFGAISDRALDRLKEPHFTCFQP